MADLISRRPPRPYKLPDAAQTSGKYPQQQYARPEVLTAKKSKSQISKAQYDKAQDIANRINSIREERIRLLFPDATPGTSFENYKQNELQNALDTLPPDQLNRYNWLVGKDQELRGELTKIIGSQASTPSRTVTRTTRSTQQPSQTQSQYSPETQKVVDKYVKNNKINISQMAKDAVAEGYRDYKGGKDVQDKWNNITKELGIAGDFSNAAEYAINLKTYGDNKGRLDVEKMIEEGYSQEYLAQLTGLEEQQYKDIKIITDYKTDEGNVNVTKMVKELPQEDVRRILNISDSEYKDLQTVAAHTDDQGNVDIAKLIDYGYSYDMLNRTLGLAKSDYDSISKKISAQNQLKPFMDDNGQLDLVAAIEADKLDIIQQVYDVKNEDVAKTLDYLELKDKGYVDNQGNVDIMQIIVDDKVDDRTLTNALNIKTEDLNTYKTTAKYVDSDGNVDLMKAVEDNNLAEVQKVIDIPQQDLAKIFDYLELKDKGYVDQEGKVNVLTAIKDAKVDQRTLTNALDIPKSDYDEYATLAKHMDSKGNIDIMKALDQGVEPELLQKHLDFDMNEIEAIQEQQAAMDKLTNYLDVGIGDKAVSSKEARLLKNPRVDVLSAISDGVEFETLNDAIGIEKNDYDNLKTISQYSDKDGQIDVVKALYHGVDPDMLQKQLDISDKDMKELKDYAKYEYWEPRYTEVSTKDIDKMVEGKWNQNEKAAVVGAMVEAGAYDQDIKDRINQVGAHTTTDAKKIWNGLSDTDKEKVASLYMTWYDRAASTNMPLIEASFDTLEKVVGKIGSSDIKLPQWAHGALVGAFPVLGLGGYARFMPDDKYKSFEDKREAVQSLVHQYVNPAYIHSLKYDKDWKDGSPLKRFGHNVVSGLTDIILAMSMDIPVTVQAASEKYQRKDYNAAAAEAVSLGGGMLLFPASLAKQTLRDAPAGAGYTIGSLCLPVKVLRGIYKAAGKTRTYVDPYGIPDRMAAIEFSTGRVPIIKTAGVKLVQELVTKATKEIVSGKESGVIRKGGWELKYRTTPIQRAGASAVWHGTPDATPFAKLKPGETFVVDPKGALFTSAYATPRFVAATSMGKPAVKPGYVMVITDAGKIMTRTTGKKGLTGPFKTYKNKIETEVVANPKSTFIRTKNLRTRILGPKAGEFFTQYMGPDVPGLRSGSLVPVHVFIDRAVKGKGPLSPATLYAAKLTMIREALIDYATALKHPKRTIKDIISFKKVWNNKLQRYETKVKHRQGPPGVREMEISKLARDLEAKALENILKKDLKGKTLEDALRVELERQFRANAGRIYRDLSAKNLESYYKTPEGQRRYEEIYNSYMEPVLRDAVRTYQTTDAVARTAAEYTESMPRATLEATSVEVERELPEEERYVMTVKRRQSLREHPRVNVDRAITDEPRAVDSRTDLDARTLSIPAEPRIMTTAARAELRTDSTTAKRLVAPYKAPAQPKKITVPPERIPPPKYPISRKKKAPEEKLDEGDSKKKRSEKPGTIHWRQGMWWISLIPRGRDKYVKVYTKAPPPGAPTKKRTPEETFFTKGGPENIPSELKAQLGFMNVNIMPSGDPNLRFGRRRRR